MALADGERREPGRLPVSGQSGRGAGRCGQPMSGPAHARETAASAAQYLLLGGFTAAAAGISAQGLTGFARDNMGLRGPWPYLLFLALDGAAGVCAVLLTRRAARAESGLAPRLAVWGLVAASASFNATHAPHRPGAPEAFGLMPVIGAVLFEFTLRELRQRAAGRADRPAAVLLFGILHFFSEDDDPAGVVRRLVSPLAAGSYVAITHLARDVAGDALTETFSRLNAEMAESVVRRTRDEVAALFGNLESIEPGVVQLPQWHQAPDALAPGPLPMWCGVARKTAGRFWRPGFDIDPA